MSSTKRANAKTESALAEMGQKALAAQHAGDLESAEKLFSTVLESNPTEVAALYSLGVIHYQKTRLGPALSLFDRAIKANPNFGQAYAARAAVHSALGHIDLAQRDQGRHAQILQADATAPTRKLASAAIAVPALTDVLNEAGAHTQRGDVDAALATYRSYLPVGDRATLYIALYNMGVILIGAKRLLEAEACFRQTVALTPDFLQGQLSLGTVLELSEQPDKALVQWEAAIEQENFKLETHQADAIQIYNNLGRLYEKLRRFDKAEEFLKASIRIKADQAGPLQHLVHLRQRQCEWPVLHGLPPAAAQAASPLAMLGLADDPSDLLECARHFAEEKVGKFERLVPFLHRYGHTKLRIGYLSSDLSMHAVSMLTVELFETHDREQVEVHAFCWSKEDGTVFRQRVKNAFDHYHLIGSLDDAAAAALIKSKEIDVLVDLQGITAGARPNIVARGPAPVQIAYLGYPGTSALPWVDYVIADRFVYPAELQEHFTEKPLYMPTVFQVSDSQRVIGPLPQRQDFDLPEDRFVFCAFNNNYKIKPEMFESWMRILRRVRNGVLWLLEDNAASRENLTRAAMAHGVDPERLYFAGRLSPEHYLARFTVADLFLDTAPYNAGTTASDALWVGLPLLTLSGRTYVSRMAGALLTHAGLDELVTYSHQDYEDRAVQMASEPQRLRALKDRLAQKKREGRLFNTQQFCIEFEAALKQLLS